MKQCQTSVYIQTHDVCSTGAALPTRRAENKPRYVGTSRTPVKTIVIVHKLRPHKLLKLSSLWPAMSKHCGKRKSCLLRNQGLCAPRALLGRLPDLSRTRFTAQARRTCNVLISKLEKRSRFGRFYRLPDSPRTSPGRPSNASRALIGRLSGSSESHRCQLKLRCLLKAVYD